MTAAKGASPDNGNTLTTAAVPRTELETATPREIDTRLADIEEHAALLAQRATLAARELRRAQQGNARLAQGERRYASYTDDYVERCRTAHEHAAQVADTAWQEGAPYRAEFVRRGGWTRAFLVLNTNGHVHRTTSCTTTYTTTRWGWLPQLSGQSEEQIVSAAGSDACTICYPTAPVELRSRPRSVQHHTEHAAAAQRAQRDTARAAREAKRTAAAIAGPDGSPLRVHDGHVPERVIRDQAGATRLTPAHDTFRTLSTAAAAKTWLTHVFDGGSARPEDLQTVAEALAARNGTSVDVELQAARARARRR